MSTSHTEPRPVLPRVAGAAVTGAVLATGASHFISWTRRDSARACEKTDGLCWTWWDLAALPLAFTASAITLILVYKQLGIRPRFAVIPPTIVLGPLPLVAAQTTAGWWAAAITGGAWSCFLALIAWDRYQILGITASATLLLVSLVVLYH